MPVLWFRASTCFEFWSKTFTKRCTNNSLVSHTEQFLPCLNWLVTCFRFQNMLWRNINCFQFWWKTYRKRCTSNFSPQHFAVGQVLSISRCNLENGRMPCQQKFYIKNMAVAIPIFIFFSAFVYFADLKSSYFVSCLCCSCKLF